MSGCRSFALNIVNTTFVECEMYNIGEIYGNYSMTSASTGWFLFVSDGWMGDAEQLICQHCYLLKSLCNRTIYLIE